MAKKYRKFSMTSIQERERATIEAAKLAAEAAKLAEKATKVANLQAQYNAMWRLVGEQSAILADYTLPNSARIAAKTKREEIAHKMGEISEIATMLGGNLFANVPREKVEKDGGLGWHDVADAIDGEYDW